MVLNHFSTPFHLASSQPSFASSSGLDSLSGLVQGPPWTPQYPSSPWHVVAPFVVVIYIYICCFLLSIAFLDPSETESKLHVGTSDESCERSVSALVPTSITDFSSSPQIGTCVFPQSLLLYLYLARA